MYKKIIVFKITTNLYLKQVIFCNIYLTKPLIIYDLYPYKFKIYDAQFYLKKKTRVSAAYGQTLIHFIYNLFIWIIINPVATVFLKDLSKYTFTAFPKAIQYSFIVFVLFLRMIKLIEILIQCLPGLKWKLIYCWVDKETVAGLKTKFLLYIILSC